MQESQLKREGSPRYCSPMSPCDCACCSETYPSNVSTDSSMKGQARCAGCQMALVNEDVADNGEVENEF